MNRPPHYAGRYYLPDAGRLRAWVESYIEDAVIPRLQGRLLGLIVPHSQLSEFGPIAGTAYKTLLTVPLTWNRVLMLAPTADAGHALRCDPSDAYDTLLEPLPIDRDGIVALRRAGVSIDDTDDDEPIIECHAPFVEAALGQVPVMPLRVSHSTHVEPRAVAALAAQADLVIACANLPPDYERPSVDAIMRLDASYFDGSDGAKRTGLLTRKPHTPPRSPDAATLGLALAVAKAGGATHAIALKSAGVFGAFAMVRS